MDYKIRTISEGEESLLQDFLYQAVFVPEGVPAPPKSIISQPELQIYITGFGTKKDDIGLVAEVNRKAVGAVWVRIMNDYGHIDNATPSIAVSLYKDYRGYGIGTALMKEMLRILKDRGYKQASLSVQKANYAVNMAHGIPDASRVEDDGDSRNIELPFSKVNHLKVTTHQQYAWEKLILSGDLGFQNNHREEWSAFHTHYGSQPAPEKDPDKELAFNLNTFSASVKARFIGSSSWEHTLGWDGQHQRNDISGYSFLLPEYRRSTTGMLWLTTYRPNNVFSVSGGVRYDYGYMNISSHEDTYLADYLRKQGYDPEQIDFYKWNSHSVNKHYGDYSLSLGLVWTPSDKHLVKVNIGRSFRLPGANELAANGVHHGTFRHEQGDANLKSEQGWQLDASYHLKYRGISFSVSPFVSWFSNYIFLRPTGEWSVLPHAGQIYRYTGAEALFAGTEATVDVDFLRNFNYRISAEYVYTYNCDEHIPLSFSPPPVMRNTLTWQKNRYMLYAEWQSIARQNRVDRNEDRTAGANLFHLGGSLNIPIGGNNEIEITLTARNIFDTRYYNHLSFYRKVEIPEPGRNFQILIKVPFKKLLK